MWSHAITDASIGAGEAVSVENNSCLCLRPEQHEPGRPPHLHLECVYQLPFGRGRRFMNDGLAGKIVGGWDLSGTMSARTGLPMNITMSRSASQCWTASPPASVRTWFPACRSILLAALLSPIGSILVAFTTPAKYTWGNVPRYAAVGPGNYEIDTALSKRITFSEHTGLTFRAEAFNLFNHPMFSNLGSWAVTAIGNRQITEPMPPSGKSPRFLTPELPATELRVACNSAYGSTSKLSPIGQGTWGIAIAPCPLAAFIYSSDD